MLISISEELIRISKALDLDVECTILEIPPPAGINPNFVSGNPIFESVEIILKSQLKSNSKPPAKQWPLDIPIMGFLYNLFFL